MQSYSGHSTQPLANEYTLNKFTQKHSYWCLSNIREFNELKQRKLNLITFEMLRFQERKKQCFVQADHFSGRYHQKEEKKTRCNSNSKKNETNFVIFEHAKRTSIVKCLDLFDFSLADFN